MALLRTKYHNIMPYLIVIFFVTLFFTLASIYPYEIRSDPALQIKSVQQWLRQEAKLFNAVVLPNHRDLSKNVEAWILMWTPGIPIFFLPLIALGLPLGLALRITAYILFILGCLGWIKVADKIRVGFLTKIIFSLILPMYSLTVASVTRLLGDVLPFGIMPWLFLYTLHFSLNLNSKEKSYIYTLLNSCLLGFFLGVAYWLKYSALLASLGLLSYLVIHLLFFTHRYSLKRRLVLLGACIFLFSLPVIILTLLNQRFTGTNYLAVLKSPADPTHKDITLSGIPFYIKWLYLFCSLLGAWGLALFQSSRWLMHIIYFSDRIFPIFSSLKLYQRAIFFAVSGIPATLIVTWLLLYSRKLFNKMIFFFTCCVTVIPTISLLAVSYIAGSVGFNYLVFICEDYRFTPVFFIFLEIILISSFLHFVSSHKKTIAKVFVFFVLFVFFIVPNAFILVNFIKNGIFERIGQRYIATKNLLFEPGLSNTNAKLAIDRIESLVESARDVVVLAVIDPDGASTVPWLEIKQRTLPLGYSSRHLIHTHGIEGVNLLGSQPFVTSERLRVILVISKFLEEDGQTLSRLKQRFTQAKSWFRLTDTPESDNLVSIWYADLDVS